MRAPAIGFRQTCYVILLTSAWACAANRPPVRDVTELAPPTRVTYTVENGTVKIVWGASPDTGRAYFEGYNVYYAPRSLMLSAFDDLPTPILADKTQHGVQLTDLKPAVRYFIHVRSRDTSGRVSLPSLPELDVRLEPAK